MSTGAEAPRPPAGLSFRNILLATDFSDASEKAFHYATAIARIYASKIYLVHVLYPESMAYAPEPAIGRIPYEAERKMNTLAGRSELQEVAHESVLLSGSMWSALSAVIKERNIDLIVLGTHGRAGLKKLVLGSVAEEVVRRAGCPVMTVGPHIDHPSSAPRLFQRILFATDFHPASVKAFQYALLLADQFQAKLILLHSISPVAPPGPGLLFYNEDVTDEWQAKAQATARKKLEDLLPADARLRPELEYVVGFDFVGEHLLKAAAEQTVDLIVMGANRPASPALSTHVPGTVASEIIRHARCAVLTVSAGTPQSQTRAAPPAR